MALDKVDVHWAFLDEIEAPMWADLTLEAKSNGQDVDDEWFCISHPIHQCSSRKLKSALSHSGEGDTVAGSDIEKPHSTEVPLSVSRSRGNKYKSKKWKENGCKLFSSKPHTSKILSEEPVGVKRKPKSSFPALKKVSQTKLVHERSSAENLKANCSKPVSARSSSTSSLNSKVEDTVGRSSSTGRSVECTSTQHSKEAYANTISSSSSSVSNLNSKVDEAGARSSSTITLVNSQQQNFSEVLKLEVNKESSLLAVMKISLRKSCARRQPSRVEVNNDNKRESNGSKSFSGKSSVGSSCNPGHDVKSLTVSSRMVKEITPDSKNVVKMTQAVKNKAKISYVSKASTMQVDKLKMGDKKKAVFQEAPKAKVLCPKSHSNSFPSMLKGKESLTASTKGDAKVKIGVNGLNKVAAAGKENARGKVAMNQSTNGRGIGARGILFDQKGIKQNALQKEDKTGLFGLKQGKTSAPNKRKPTNTIQRPHFR